MRNSLLLLMVLALFACNGAREEAAEVADHPEPANPATDEVDQAAVREMAATTEGIVQVVGSDPHPQVVLSVEGETGPTQIGLYGEFSDELGRLHGVAVTVSGDVGPNPQGIPEDAIEVIGYDVLTVNDDPAYLGVLEIRENEWWLVRDEPLKLTSVPDALQEIPGAKVWVAGPLDEGAVRIQSYGIVR